MKKTLTVMLVLCLSVVLLAGCGTAGKTSAAETPAAAATAEPTAATAAEPASTEAPITLRLGTSSARGVAHTEDLYQFQELIESKTDRFAIEIYPACQYGTTTEMVAACQSGALQCCALPAAFFASTVPLMNLLDCPGAFGDAETMFNILNDGVDSIHAAFQAVGMYDVGWAYPNNMWTICTKDISSVSDMKGLKLRVSANDVYMQIAKGFNIEPVVISTGDIPTAMQQGTLDGGMLGPTIIDSFALYEMAKTMIAVPYIPTPCAVVFNSEWLDSLPSDLKTLLIDCFQEVLRGENRDMVLSEQQTIVDKVSAAGVKVIPYEDIADEVNAVLDPIAEAFPTNFPDYADAYNEVIALRDAYPAA